MNEWWDGMAGVLSTEKNICGYRERVLSDLG